MNPLFYMSNQTNFVEDLFFPQENLVKSISQQNDCYATQFPTTNILPLPW